ncbi:MAG: hypothetical protein FRX48_03837 [Lasallia pustulata]|uniref:Leucine-rich repeat, typical subtype n=1 Tax=Lasallia pustulata TaxID=136370 RepID=A0A5M8PTW7_9LECA|nr:MAG: hypothetical protein FRX48_03837 [Lasallia pustulata]
MDEHRTPALSKPSGIPRLSRLPLPRATRAEPLKDPGQDCPALPSRGLNVSRIRSKYSTNSIKDTPSVGPSRGSKITGKSHTNNNRDPSSSVALLSEPSSIGHSVEGPSARLPPPGQDATETTVSTTAELDGNQELLQEHQGSYGSLQQPKSRDIFDQRRPRPSLSERTIETLSHIPPSPSPRRRKSSFFTMESPMRPPSRPASALNRSRPTSSMAQRSTSPGKRSVALHMAQQSAAASPSRRVVSSLVSRASPKAIKTERASPLSSSIKLQRPSNAIISSATGNRQKPCGPLHGSKTYSARSSKPRQALNGILAGPPSPKKSPTGRNETGQPDGLVSGLANDSKPSRPITSRTSHQAPRASAKSEDCPQQASLDAGSRKVSTSSAALRKTIAEAKAARRAALQGGSSLSADIQNSSNSRAQTDAEAGFFSPELIEFGNPGLLRKRIDTARTDGRLNIAAMGLKSIPEEVMKMYDIETLNASAGAWYESVDLSRLIAADNEIEEVGDDIFPDVQLGANDEFNEEQKGNQFGGLGTLDLHGNRLKALPLGLRRLEHLTTLNVSSNRLSNDCLEVVTQISHLKELRLAKNALEGSLTESVRNLSGLEVLDIHDNRLASLPDAICELLNLRILDVSGNCLTTLPFVALAQLPLKEITASRNKLNSTLLPVSIDELPKLQTLDVSNNALTSLTEKSCFRMPLLMYLNVSVNRLSHLPDLTGWTRLLTLNAEDNKLTSIPEGLFSLASLKNIEFTGNSISKLDNRIGFMDHLSVLRVANNPLRERRLLTLNTEDLKQALRERLGADETPTGLDDEATVGDQPSQQVSAWPVKAGGILDRSNTKLQTLETSDLEAVVASNAIRTLTLHHNLLPQLPASIKILGTTLTALDLSHNTLRSDTYMSTPLSLPHLKSLDFSCNTITTFTPLLSHLSAPLLAHLSISYNRITALPPLRPHFPQLATLLASDNSIAALPVEAVRGLTTLDVARNDIGFLEPRLGLLEGGLKSLVVGGNRFRVPRYTVLDRGTKATLEWLRGRIPAGEEEGGKEEDSLD